VLEIWSEQTGAAVRVEPSNSTFLQCTTSGCTQYPAPFYIAWSPDSRQLAYGVGDSAIKAVNSDGSNPRVYRLPTRSYHASLVRWSPNGELLTYVPRDVQSGLASGTIVGIKALDGSGEVSLVSAGSPIIDYQWSSDSRKIALSEQSGVSVWSDGARLGGTEFFAGARSISWSPDNTRIAFVGYPWIATASGRISDSPDIYTVSSQGGDARRVSYFPLYSSFRGLSWTSDGRMLSFLWHGLAFHGLAFIDVAGGAVYRVMPDVASFSLTRP
jgi:Tol biopolymer transport system component